MQWAAVSFPWRRASSVIAAELGHGVRGAVRIGGAGGAAGGHDLDVVGALLEELAHLRPHGGLPVGLGAEVAHVTAGDRDRPPADDHARPRGELPADALAERERDAGPWRRSPAASSRPSAAGCARSWRPAGAGCRRPPSRRRRRACRRRARRGACARRRARAGSSQPRSPSAPRTTRPARDIARAAEAHDAVTVDEQRRMRHGRRAAAVEEMRGREQRVACRSFAHGWGSVASQAGPVK